MTASELTWPPDGLLPVAIVDARTNALLTLAYADREALALTLETGATHLYSRSRQALWRKGETSGNTQRVVSVDVDCDGDALLYRVIAHGPACHTGAPSCFHRSLEMLAPADETLADVGAFAQATGQLPAVIAERRGADPQASYVAKMFERGLDFMLKKLGEEATEVVIAAKNRERPEVIWEAADLLFHLFVVLQEQQVTLDEVGAELLRRHAARAAVVGTA